LTEPILSVSLMMCQIRFWHPSLILYRSPNFKNIPAYLGPWHMGAAEWAPPFGRSPFGRRDIMGAGTNGRRRLGAGRFGATV